MKPLDLRARGSDSGETLIEILVTVVILGLTIVAMVAGMATAISASTYNRRQANTDVVTKNYAEALRLLVSQLTADDWCKGSNTTPTNYGTITYVKPNDWNGSVNATYGTCPAKTSVSGNTPQFQTITITAKSSDGYDSETQTIVVSPNWCYASSTC